METRTNSAPNGLFRKNQHGFVEWLKSRAKIRTVAAFAKLLLNRLILSN